MTLIEALVRAKHPDTAKKMAVMAEEFAKAFDGMTLPDGAMTIPPSQFEEFIKSVQGKVAERIDELESRNPE